MAGKEVIKNMEYLMKLLHKEWERSGETKAEVTIGFEDLEKVKVKLGEAIQERQLQIEIEKITFRRSMELSKENFILLRLVRKIKKVAERTSLKREEPSFAVEMDKEEYKLFSMLVDVEGA